MSEYVVSSDPSDPHPIAFAERFANSDTFRDLFREGMTLVEETASYLDGEGRRDSRTLPRAGSLLYTTESMRLTTRLMQLASWLLLQRAVNEGEISSEQANSEKRKVRLDGVPTASAVAGYDELPDALRSLIERSSRLQERIRHLDQAMYGPKPVVDATANPVARDLGRLADAFGARRD
ncbi:DUF1465 family protein [Chthonobacter rhizosphaerae]|uniref:protease adaptor protein RcdA n=1 Tax=Chthonobacter rhizosphaerae TaxID=2735553 RepID=UPI0015EF5FBF|nr:DUF1465 family protein [Chthonobacter rhizosphaerae]